MIIYRSLETDRLTQEFGENRACLTLDGRVVTAYRNGRCPDNSRPFYKSIGMDGHNGEDMACFYKEPIYFPVVAHKQGGGVVTWYSKDASDMAGGLGVDVFSKEPVLFESLPEQAGKQAKALWLSQNRHIRVKFRFWHLFRGWPDRNVTIGEMIGLGDSTGASSGDHLHWGMKFVGQGDETLDRDNGFFGAVDFSQWQKNQFILEKLQKKSVLSNAQKVYRVAYKFRMPILRKVGALLEQ